jgi:hypothetical protein
VAWQLIGEGVEVVISNGRLRINLAGREVAVYAETGGRRQRVVDSAPGGEACEKFIATQSRGFCRRAAQQDSTIRWPSTEVGMATSIASLPGELREARLFQRVELRIVS